MGVVQTLWNSAIITSNVYGLEEEDELLIEEKSMLSKTQWQLQT